MAHPRDRELPTLSQAMRGAWQDLRADYAMGTSTRYRPNPPGVSSMGSGADYHNPKRISQRRGVTAFVPVVDPIGMHDDVQFATLVKAQVVLRAAHWLVTF